MMRTCPLAIALVLLAAAPARAQDTSPGDRRWGPWLGCWHLVQENRGSLATVTPSDEGVLVCVLPAAAGQGVGMTTYVAGRSVVQQTIVTDGASHPVREPGCRGSQQSEWSLTGQRLFTRAELVCGDQPARTVSGIMLMVDGPTWVDIQAVGTDRDVQVRVRRYQRTSSLLEGAVLQADLRGREAAAQAGFTAVTTMSLEEVVDASRKIAAPAVEAALIETGSRFDLNGRALRELDVADVPDGVIDVMVALSFPGRVALDYPLRGLSAQTSGATTASVQRSNRLPSYPRSPYDSPAAYYPSYAYDPYAVYGSYYPYYFYATPFGYSNWWDTSYGPWDSGGLRPVIGSPGRLARPSGNGGGRVIQGHGYTQGGAEGAQNAPRTRADGADEEVSRSGGATSGVSSRRAVSRGGYSRGGSSSGTRSGGGSSSSGGGSSSGSGSGSSSGRTAQPR